MGMKSDVSLTSADNFSLCTTATSTKPGEESTIRPRSMDDPIMALKVSHHLPFRGLLRLEFGYVVHAAGDQ